MLSISPGKSAGAAAEYFKEGYYTNEGEHLAENSFWHGAAAENLDLVGPVDKQSFERILEGQHPGTGERLVSSKATKDGEERRGGNDMTFSAPKSVSVAFAAGVVGIREAHEEAVKRTLDYAEKNFSEYRSGGQAHRASSAIWGAFTHETSRAQEPQLHTHAFMVNAVQDKQGGWHANEPKAVFQGKLDIGQIYRHELAHNLQQQGFNIEYKDKEQGFFELRGVPQQAIDTFSSRATQIKTLVDQWEQEGKFSGVGREKLEEMAAKATRDSKKEISASQLQEQWAAQAKGGGFEMTAIREAVEQSKTPGRQASTTDTAELVREAAAHLNQTEAVFSRTDLVRTATILDNGQHSLQEIEKVMGRELVPLGQDQRRKDVFTTVEMQHQERSVVQEMATAAPFHSMVKADDVGKWLKEFEAREKITLTEGQRNYVTAELAGRHGMTVVQGDPGTGKTFAAQVVEQYSKNVMGGRHYSINTAYTGKAAAELSESTSKPAYTLDALLNAYERGSVRVGDTHAVTRAEQRNRAVLNAAERLDRGAGIDAERIQQAASSFSKSSERRAALGQTIFSLGAFKASYSRETGMTATQTHGRLEGLQGDTTKTTVVHHGKDFQSRLISSARGDIWRTTTTNGEVRKKDGTVTKVKESRTKSLLETRSRRTERSNDGGTKHTKSRTWGRRTKGVTTVVRPDGRVFQTHWEGKRTLISGRWVQQATTRELTGKEADKYRHNLPERMIRNAVRAVMVTRQVIGGRSLGNPSVVSPQSPQENRQCKGRAEIVIPRNAQVVVRVDEASMLSAQHAQRLNAMANDLREQGVQVKTVLIGDQKQLPGVQAGAVFRHAQALTDADKVRLSEIQRQKDEGLRKVATDLNRGTTVKEHGQNARAAVKSLSAMNRVHEVKNLSDARQGSATMHRQLAQKYGEGGVITLTTTNAERMKMNQEIRHALGRKGGEVRNVLTPAKEGVAPRTFKVGQQVEFPSKNVAKGGGLAGTIVSVEKGKIAVRFPTGAQKIFTARELNEVQSYNVEKREFQVGERVVATKNDKKNGLMNGELGTVRKIENDKIHIEKDNGKMAALDSRKSLHLDHGYAVTVHKSQGMTTEGVVLHAPSGNISYQHLNVSATRQKNDLHVITTDVKRLGQSVSKMQEKTSTINETKVKKIETTERKKTDGQEMTKDNQSLGDEKVPKQQELER